VGWLRWFRREEKAALAALGILALLEWRFGGHPRLGTYFTRRGVGLLGVVALLYSRFAERDDAPVRRRSFASVCHGATEFIRDWLPFVTLIVVYENLLPLIRSIRPSLYDEAALRADRALFGETPSVWLQPFITPGRTEWLALFYLSLFALPIVSAGLLYLAGRRTEFREFLLAFTAAGFLGYLGYLLIPVVGPRYYFPELYRLTLFGVPSAAPVALAMPGSFSAVAERISHAAAHPGNQPPNCFPSLHTAWGLIALILAYRRTRWLFYCYLLPVSSLIFATVYLRFHYMVDVIAGAALAVVVCIWASSASQSDRAGALSKPLRAVPLPNAARTALARMSGLFSNYWPYLPLCFVALVYVSSLPTGLTPRNAGQDGAELVTAALVGGTAHPPGYPLYTLLLRGVCYLIPSSDAIDVAHAFSAVLALATGGVVITLVREWLRRKEPSAPPWLSATAACLSGVSLCFSSTLFSQAIIAEVYALHALLIATTLLLAMRLLLDPGRASRRDALAFGVVAGLAASHHLTALPVLAAEIILLAVSPAARLLGWRGALACAGGVALGLLPWLYLPWSASRAPALSWGQPDSFERLFAVVSAAQYRARLGGTFSECLSRLTAHMPWRDPSPLLLALTTVGFAASIFRFSSRREPASRVALLLALAALANVSTSSLYQIPDLKSYFLPAEICTAALVGVGLARVGMSLVELIGSSWAHRSTVLVAFSTSLLALLSSLKRADAHGESPLDREVRAIVRSAPKDALIVARGDNMVFGLWYERFVRSKRNDLDIVGRELLMLPWYSRQQHHFTSAMRFPDQPISGGPSARLLAVIQANYAFRPILVVHPADVPRACVRTREGILRCGTEHAKAELGP
jgi:membrane-associated phospholipid phosphatase